MKTHFALLPVMQSLAAARWAGSNGQDIKYSTVQGFFLQDEPTTNPSGFDYAQDNFGLLNRTYSTDASFDPSGEKTQWERFAHFVDHLNAGCKHDQRNYKLLVMGRHGEGYHNAAESYYGTPAWNCYWSELDGNATTTWSDPLLTTDGVAEAEKANRYFDSRFSDYGMPRFQSFYVSPLMRCLYTAQITFGDLVPQPFAPTIKEKLREGISVHTCDRRSSKATIHERFPDFKFEKHFAKKDPLWEGGENGEGETHEHQIARSKEVLDDVFRHDDATWISVTSHSGEIRSLLEVLGHQPFSLSTGQIIPVLVKAELVAPTPTTSIVGFTPEATCDNGPPVTSIRGQGCVCSGTAEATGQPETRNVAGNKHDEV